MATMSAESPPLVVVDTNVLLAATDSSRDLHRAAASFLAEDERRLAITPQILREYLAVATRPVAANGLGMSSADARANADEILAVSTLLTEGSATTVRLLELLADGRAVGKQVHDANVVACALAHGAAAIVTDNTRHFARFASLIPIEPVVA